MRNQQAGNLFLGLQGVMRERTCKKKQEIIGLMATRHKILTCLGYVGGKQHSLMMIRLSCPSFVLPLFRGFRSSYSWPHQRGKGQVNSNQTLKKGEKVDAVGHIHSTSDRWTFITKWATGKTSDVNLRPTKRSSTSVHRIQTWLLGF